MHDHPISTLDEFDRRKLLKGSLIGLGAIFLNNFSNASAADIKLSGFDKFSEKVKIFKDFMQEVNHNLNLFYACHERKLEVILVSSLKPR